MDLGLSEEIDGKILNTACLSFNSTLVLAEIENDQRTTTEDKQNVCAPAHDASYPNAPPDRLTSHIDPWY